jgi:hypothetical protein
MTYSVTFFKQMSVRRIKIICKSILIEAIKNVDDTSVTWNNDHTLYEMEGFLDYQTPNQASASRTGNGRMWNVRSMCNVNISEV